MLYAMLSHNGAFPIIALLFAAALALLAGRLRARWLAVPVWVLAGFAALFCAAGLYGSWRIHSITAATPAPGEMVDVGGYRMHILAEGASPLGAAPVIWIAGQHSAGFALKHLHDGIKADYRSILFDRPGAGWSEAGPFPRRTALEAAELHTLLERAGERGPFVVVGHSYGGLLAVNFARRYPEQVAALVLLDATPPDSLVYGGFDGLAMVSRLGMLQALARSVGVQSDLLDVMASRNPRAADQYLPVKEALGENLALINRAEAGPKAGWATASIFSEGAHPQVLDTAFDLVVYDGELGDMPVYVVLPGTLQSLDWDDDEAVTAFQAATGMPAADLSRFAHISEAMRYRFLQVSSAARLLRAPAGTGHLFPYETPGFVIDLVRQAVASPVPADDAVGGANAPQRR
ncbi:alpha/beta hydrolase [Pseudohalioglobus sediminis]|uniref:Alpha/beta hydrolase n=1 Tax=Pseudohalioglobus sediminis TaxID=2606449 RepID=A0A5B0X4E6_9GAMM|nr:alpha/beta hydrolase [Pseudohalioglobus sediminis]KAA1194123.1 alpha/beta hydrolase [Pseudohalioglobus sediminis]